MAKKSLHDALSAQLAGAEVILESLPPSDIVGRASFESRVRDLRQELDALGEQVDTVGSVLLSFEGLPVEGSRGVNADFAARALHSYQDLITKQVATLEGIELYQRGPVPLSDFSKLKITELVRGSVGFQLEEDTDEPEFVDSALKNAIVAVDQLIRDFADPNPEVFQQALEGVDRRVFISLKGFYENLYRNSATVKVTDPEIAFSVDRQYVAEARERLHGLSVDDAEHRVRGELIGLVPFQRRFEFRDENGVVIAGRVGQKLSDDYLERLHGEERISGRQYVAHLLRRIARSPDGNEQVSFTLLNLEDV